MYYDGKVIRQAAREELQRWNEEKSWKLAEIRALKEKLNPFSRTISENIRVVRTLRGPARASLQIEIDELKDEQQDLRDDLNKLYEELKDIFHEIDELKTILGY